MKDHGTQIDMETGQPVPTHETRYEEPDPIPSKFVVVKVRYGENQAHLYHDDEESPDFCKDEDEARDNAQDNCHDGDLYAVCEVKYLVKRKPTQFDHIKGEG